MTSSDQPGPLSEPPEPLDVVETPTSPSSGLALSRFEFETGKANDGTKVLMVEWDSSAWDKGQQRYADRDGKQGDEWDVSWEGKEKTKVLMVRDADVETESSTRRVYFLLPPGASIPTLVTIRRQDKGSCRSNDNDDVVLRTKPMPAIFPAELTGYQAAGRRGVLHTIWAKKRLVDLKAEIEAEARVNGESVGLEMALQEQRWIIDNFGLDPDPDTGLPQPTRLYIPQTSVTVSSPRSPVGGRLGEKLKGLKLATSPTELAAASQEAKKAQMQRSQASITSVLPPSLSNREPGSEGIASIDALVGGGGPTPTAANDQNSDDTAAEDDLFALPMSPRSPEMKRSPFSILHHDKAEQ